MSVLEELYLNPFEKWSRYGRFPTMLFVHALLLILVTGQVMFYLTRDITHACHAASHFSTLFLGTARGTTTLRQPGELQDAVENAVGNIFAINDVTFNDVVLAKAPPGHPALSADLVEVEPDTLTLKMQFRNATVHYAVLHRSAFVGQAGSADKASSEDVRKYVARTVPVLYCRDVRELQEIELSVVLLETVHLLPEKGHFIWSITLRFDGTNVGRFVGSLTYELKTSGRGFGGNLLTIVVAVAAGALIIRKCMRSVSVLQKLRQSAGPTTDGMQDGASAVSLTWREELALFSWWWGVSALCHIVQIIASLSCLRRSPNVTDRFSWLGWSCCLTWLNICQYLEFFPGYYVTFSTTGKGMASVCRYMTSVLPILTAFMFLGPCHFWQADTFQGVQASYASLFSLLNGDMVHDAFMDLGAVGGWAGHLYLYLFIFLFIYIILNVNITIIEEAYYSAHFQGLKHEEQVESSKRMVSRLNSPETFSRMATDESIASQDPGASADSSQLQRYGNNGATPAPNVLESRSTAPLLDFRDSSEAPNPRLYVKGSVSPRILDNPRLQGALSSAFPPASARSRARGSDDPEGRAPKRSHTWDCTKLTFSVPEEEDLLALGEAPRQISGPKSESTGTAEWWLEKLPQWTASLRTMPLPSRSQTTRYRKDGWGVLEKAIADHSAAIGEVSAQLYRELART